MFGPFVHLTGLARGTSPSVEDVVVSSAIPLNKEEADIYNGGRPPQKYPQPIPGGPQELGIHVR